MYTFTAKWHGASWEMCDARLRKCAMPGLGKGSFPILLGHFSLKYQVLSRCFVKLCI